MQSPHEARSDIGRRRRRDLSSTAPIIAAGALLLVIPLLLTGWWDGEEPQPAKRIPDLVGMRFEQAKATFRRAGGEVVKARPRASPRPPGTVLRQTPPAGELFTHSIELVVSRPRE